MTVLQMQRQRYFWKLKTMFQYKVTETPENIAEKSFTSAWRKEGGLIERGGLLQNLTSKGGAY